MFNWKKFIFFILGGISLFYILRSYGLNHILTDFKKINFWIFPLLFTFLPTLFCYSLAWQLVTDQQLKWSRFFYFTKMTIVSIAWNNLTPFLKIAGEPLKVFMLMRGVSQKQAIKSVLIYNFVHILGTFLSIILSLFLIPLIFNVPDFLRTSLLIGGGIGIILFLILILFSAKSQTFLKSLSNRKFFFRRPIFWLNWFVRVLSRFYRKDQQRFMVVIFLETIARFIEGLTFYLAFYLLENPIHLITAAFLEVGRALIDNIFFFIPYQVGSREAGIYFLMKEIFQLDPQGYLTSSFIYRLVEIVWMIIGYFLWLHFQDRKKLKISSH